MPESFCKDYPDCRLILDATECKIAHPSEVGESVLTYSDYKSNQTMKFLVGIIPSGEITFLSDVYGGRATDSLIVNESNLLELIEPGDQVLADKGFPGINNMLNSKGSILVMPPFKRGGQQFITDENEKGYCVARNRIHVERAIQRMKVFDVLKFFPHYLLQQADKIVRVIAFFANNFDDLIKRVECEPEDSTE